MRSKKEGAAPRKATPSTNQLKIKYQKESAKSSRNLRNEIGELLWCLQFPVGELSQVGWGLLERMLRRHVALNYTSKRLSEPLESTNTLQGVSGVGYETGKRVYHYQRP